MGFWQRLLSIRTDGEATFRTFDVSLRAVTPLLWTLLVTILAGAVVARIYWSESQRMSSKRRVLLTGLRVLAVFLLCTMVFRPFNVSAVFEEERPRNVVLLIDNTQSMLRREERRTPEDLLRVAVAQNLVAPDANVANQALLKKLPKSLVSSPPRLQVVRDVFANRRLQLDDSLRAVGPVQRYVFGQQPTRLAASAEADLARSLTGTETVTALADSLHALLLEGDVDLPTAVVVVTDGCDNASKRDLQLVAEKYRQLGVPLHVYGVGCTRGDSLELIEAIVPDLIFVGDTVGVPVRWRASGTNLEKVRLSLHLGDKEVGSKELTFQEGADLSETVTFVPEGEKDKQRIEKLQVKIEAVGRPEVSDSVSRPVRIVDSKIKVLCIESMPRWEHKFIQQALLRDRRVEAKFLLTEADTQTLRSGDPYVREFPKTRKALLEYDLIFLGDVKASDLIGERMVWIKEFVEKGGGLVHLAGPTRAPAELVGTPLEELLPVEVRPQRFLRSIELRITGFQPRLTRYGRRSDLLALDDDHEKNLQIWQGLPNLYWHYPVARLRGGAIALLEHPELKSGDEPMPLLALHRYGKGQVLFVAFAESWRWRFNEGEKYHNRFWGQIVYRLGLNEVTGNKRSRLALDRERVYLGQEDRLFAHLVDEELRPLEQESIDIEVRQIDGPEEERTTLAKELRPVPGVPGEYHVALANEKGGRFTVRIPGRDDAELEYQVEVPPNHELAKRGLDERRLRDAAQTSGGAFYREEDLHRLKDRIERRTKTSEVRPTVPLLNPLTFVLILGLLTAEWIVRKLSNLS